MRRRAARLLRRRRAPSTNLNAASPGGRDDKLRPMRNAFADVLDVLTVVCGGVLAGIVVSEHVIILPLVRAAAPRTGVAGLRFAGARAWRLAPACGVIAGVSATALH